MDFEYYLTRQANGLLTIDDIGNCAIDLFNDSGLEKLLIVSTDLGATKELIFGPFNPDLERLPSFTECSIKQFPYSNALINKDIRAFLTDYSFKGTQAFTIDMDEALDKCRDLIEYMKSDVY